MAIRLRTVDGVRLALCAAETDPEPGDVYLDDADDRALRIKLLRDWISEAKHMGPGAMLSIEFPNEWALMDTQKIRDAADGLDHWDAVLDELDLMERERS